MPFLNSCDHLSVPTYWEPYKLPLEAFFLPASNPAQPASYSCPLTFCHHKGKCSRLVRIDFRSNSLPVVAQVAVQAVVLQAAVVQAVVLAVVQFVVLAVPRAVAAQVGWARGSRALWIKAVVRAVRITKSITK